MLPPTLFLYTAPIPTARAVSGAVTRHTDVHSSGPALLMHIAVGLPRQALPRAFRQAQLSLQCRDGGMFQGALPRRLYPATESRCRRCRP